MPMRMVQLAIPPPIKEKKDSQIIIPTKMLIFAESLPPFLILSDKLGFDAILDPITGQIQIEAMKPKQIGKSSTSPPARLNQMHNMIEGVTGAMKPIQKSLRFDFSL